MKLKTFAFGLLFSLIIPTVASLPSSGDQQKTLELGKLEKNLRSSRFARSCERYLDLKKGTLFARGHFLGLSQLELNEKLINHVPTLLRTGFTHSLQFTFLVADYYEINPLWILAMMWTESHYETHLVSPKGAVGPMQILPTTGHELVNLFRQQHGPRYQEFLRRLSIHEINRLKCSDQKKRGRRCQLVSKKDFLKDARYLSRLMKERELNIELGILYFKQLLVQFNGSYPLATVAYNMGPNWVKARLKGRLPVGNRNRYLQRVERYYCYFLSNVL